MLKKINRGLGRRDFEVSRKEGKIIQTPLFGASVVKSETTQVGFIISKKISKKAVDRNKIRRRLAEVMKNKLPTGFKIIILVKKNILEAKLEEIIKCWMLVYEKLSTKNIEVL